ncbi:MAG: DUF2334 domain-containing protein [Gemmatimonadaceae bacterium]|nr:DUF2334 domain-containing protein [Gemmatimonadaceae bacterium]
MSIHDVTPALDEHVRALWSMCVAAGAIPALLVVPNWHGEWPLAEFPHFTNWLRSCARQGAEIVLHGARHDEVGTTRAWRDHCRAVGKTAGEGEFLTLDHASARQRIEDGLACLDAQRLRAVGFVPPAWLARRDTHEVARDVGLWFSENDREVYVHRTRTTLNAPALRWSARSAFRARVSAAVAAHRQRAWNEAPLVRLALHPQDLTHPLTARSVSRAIPQWITTRTVVQYADL